MKTLLTALVLTTLSLSSVLAYSAEGEDNQKSYYRESTYLVNNDNCTGAYYKVKTDAQYECEMEHSECEVEHWGTASISPVTNYSDLGQGWKNICTVYAIAKEVKDVSESLEASLDFGGVSCKSGSGHFNSVLLRLGFNGNVHAYSRCYNQKQSILIGVKAESKPGTIKATTPIPFKSMETCLTYLRGGFYQLKNSDAVSVASKKFSVSIYCEPNGRKASLSGIVSLF